MLNIFTLKVDDWFIIFLQLNINALILSKPLPRTILELADWQVSLHITFLSAMNDYVEVYFKYPLQEIKGDFILVWIKNRMADICEILVFDVT